MVFSEKISILTVLPVEKGSLTSPRVPVSVRLRCKSRLPGRLERLRMVLTAWSMGCWSIFLTFLAIDW